MSRADVSDTRTAIRASVRALCARFPASYWQALEPQHEYPHAFVTALTEAGLLAALIPEDYGGSGLGLRDGAIILEEINRAGANAATCHAQMYTMSVLLK